MKKFIYFLVTIYVKNHTRLSNVFHQSSTVYAYKLICGSISLLVNFAHVFSFISWKETWCITIHQKKKQIVGRDSCVISLFSIVTTVNNSYYILYLLSSRFLGNKYAAKNATTGRPKGADLATTGLPAKRKMADKLQKQKRPTLFINKFSRYSTM